eukprot:4332617-Amphidinium_carterae.2
MSTIAAYGRAVLGELRVPQADAEGLWSEGSAIGEYPKKISTRLWSSMQTRSEHMSKWSFIAKCGGARV